MKIVIVGCGKIGRAILRRLVGERHEITAIDCDSEVVHHISDNYDVFVTEENGAHYETLRHAGVDRADIFIAVTGSDETNLLACHIARQMGARHTVARIQSHSYSQESLSFLRDRLGIDRFLNPEQLTAAAICNALRFPSAVKCESFAHRFEMAEMTLRERSPLLDCPLSQLRRRTDSQVLVGAVLRDGKAYIPDGDFVLREGDKIGVLASAENMQRLLRDSGELQKTAKDIMILGGSGVAVQLVEMLSRSGCRTKIIEQNDARCQQLTGLLPRNATLICADGSRQSVLVEEGLERTDAFVSLTGTDEKNVLLASCAKSRGVPRTVAKVNQDALLEMTDTMGVDCMISSRLITADVIEQYTRAVQNSRGSGIETLYRLMGGTVEALEFRVSRDFPQLHTPLRDMRFKKGVLVAGIFRGGKALIPGGNDMIEVDDRVIVFSAGRPLLDLAGALQ